MRTGFLVGVTSVLLAACTTLTEPAEPVITVGGTSPLVDMFLRVGAETSLPPELLAALSYVQTRFQFADSEAHGKTSLGLLGLSSEDLAAGAAIAGVTEDAAHSDPEASLLASAMLVRSMAGGATSLEDVLAALEPRMRNEITRVLARGAFGRDAKGDSIVIAAHPSLVATTGTITQALGAADYALAKWEPAYSGNYQTSTRGLTDITHVVIHDVEGSYASCISWFKSSAAEVSAHYVVRSSDGEVTQMVAEKNVAWHDACFNKSTVGIEHEGFMSDPDRWFTEPMYMESAKLAIYLADKYGIPKDRAHILGHGEAPDCSDHGDPGPGWKWDHYMDLVGAGGAPTFDAADAVIDAPLSMISGERATVTITLTNHGTGAWDLDLTRLGTANPQDRDSPFFVDGDWVSPSRITGVDAPVEPEQLGTFTFDIVAPMVKEPQVFDEAFQLVEEGVGFFGSEVRVSLQVMPDSTSEDSGCNAAGAGSRSLACGMVLAGAWSIRRRRRRR